MHHPDRYQMIRKIGIDPAGSVFLASDRETNQYVFYQFIEPSEKVVPIEAGRYLERARVISRIQSPFVLPVIEVGEEENLRYVVLAFREGATLGHHIRSGFRSFSERVRISREMLEALQAGHALGVVHGNLHPEGILMDATGNVKLPFIGEPSWFTGAPNIKTSSDAAFPAEIFRAPECDGGMVPDVRSDIYSAGRIIQEIFRDFISSETEGSSEATGSSGATGDKQPAASLVESGFPSGDRLTEFAGLIAHTVEEDRGRRCRDIGPLLEELLFLQARNKVEKKKDTLLSLEGLHWQELIPWKLVVLVFALLLLLLLAYFFYRTF